MAEIGLNGTSVVAVVGELEPAGVPQHVGMNEEGEFRGHARPPCADIRLRKAVRDVPT